MKLNGAGGVWGSGVQVNQLDGCKIEFICPAGHSVVVDYAKRPVPKRLSRTACTLMVRYWKDRVTIKCQKCVKEINAKRR